MLPRLLTKYLMNFISHFVFASAKSPLPLEAQRGGWIASGNFGQREGKRLVLVKILHILELKGGHAAPPLQAITPISIQVIFQQSLFVLLFSHFVFTSTKSPLPLEAQRGGWIA